MFITAVLSMVKKGKLTFYTPLSLQKSPMDAQFKKSMDLTENAENTKTEADYIE